MSRDLRWVRVTPNTSKKKRVYKMPRAEAVHEADWAPHEEFIKQLRENGETNEQILLKLKERGLNVGFKALKKRLRKIYPVYKSSEDVAAEALLLLHEDEVLERKNAPKRRPRKRKVVKPDKAVEAGDDVVDTAMAVDDDEDVVWTAMDEAPPLADGDKEVSNQVPGGCEETEVQK